MPKAYLRTMFALIISLSACLPVCAQNQEPQHTPSPVPVVTVTPADSSANTSPSSTAAAGTSGKVPQRLKISSGVAERLLLHRVDPTYPKEARIVHIQGQVLLQATIGKDGQTHNLKVISGHPILVGAAMSAVEQWRYRPYVLNGEPVEVETTIRVQFHM